jgi:predicted transcriptional regulator
MTKLLEDAIERVRQWPAERQIEIAEMLLAFDAAGPDDETDAETLAAIDVGIEQADRGQFAVTKDIEAIFRRFRP